MMGMISIGFRLRTARIAVLLFAGTLIWGQASTSLRGVISDSQGAVVAGASVKIIQTDAGLSRTVLTDEGGGYQFVQMPPGAYDVTVMKPGFAVMTRRNVQLPVDTPITLNLTLQVSTVSETVNVNVDVSTISTSDASVGNPFSEQQIRQLPLQTRNVVELLSLQPGVTQTGEVLGAHRDQNNVTLDGVDVNDYQDAGVGASVSQQGSNANGAVSAPGFTSVLPIPLDSVEEFRVTVAGLGPEGGRSSGGQVTLITKSGTNQLHGSLYEYNRNTLTSANTWFNNEAGIGRQPLVRNQFGASLGGPVWKNRIFYFFNYERRLDASGVSEERYVPTSSLQQGVLTVQTSDGVKTINAAGLLAIDPQHLGVNPLMPNYLSQFPAGNDPAGGADGGLNFSAYRFNAPDDLDNRAYVGKMDFILDGAARHTLSIRGTLSNSTQDRVSDINGSDGLAEFPGQSAASKTLNNSKGLAATYTAVLRPNLVNSLRYGYTRQGVQDTGVGGIGVSFDSLSSLQNYNARGDGYIIPVSNILDDLTWTKGSHTITMGLNLRYLTNHRTSYDSSFASYGYAVGQALGLGEDGDNAVQSYLQEKTGDPNLTISNGQAVAAALGVLYGAIDTTNITYQFLRNGSILPQGAPSIRDFRENEYAFYVGDSWRVRKDLTINYGLRYENQRPPYETNGLQVGTTQPIQDWFDERYYLSTQGVPGNAIPNPTLTYVLNGPVNHQPSWYNPDNLNFAPRVGIAYAPQSKEGLLGKIFGGSGVFRAGAGIAYDHFGSSLITTYDQFGSAGLSTTLGNQTSYDFSTAPRFNGTNPAQTPAPPGGFPYTPPPIYAIAGSFEGIDTDLKAPYSYLLNANFARQLPGKVTIEIGYAGRLSHRLLLEGDVYQPSLDFKDTVSGLTWTQGMNLLRNDFNSISSSIGYPNQNAPNSTVATMVQNNPSLIPNDAFVESMFPALKNYFFQGSASANYFYAIYGVYNGSYLDTLHTVDREPGLYGTGTKCASRTGCFTFFPVQGSGNPTWMNAGEAAYHGGTVSIRRAFSNGLSFDLNYTLSHSIDNASGAESGEGEVNAAIENILNQKQFRGSSDFDIRNNFNGNVLYQLPIGKGKLVLRNAPGWLDEIVDGWQISTIMRVSSGLPSDIQGTFAFNTSYWFPSLAIPAGQFQEHQGIDAQGNPSLFANTNVINAFADQAPGQTGTRAIVRLAGITNFDIAAAKAFKLPLEGHTIQFRAEAFNAFNNVNFISPSLALYQPATFGEYQSTMPPRVMQFALRYQF
jgi:hypothetical protein